MSCYVLYYILSYSYPIISGGSSEGGAGRAEEGAGDQVAPNEAPTCQQTTTCVAPFVGTSSWCLCCITCRLLYHIMLYNHYDVPLHHSTCLYTMLLVCIVLQYYYIVCVYVLLFNESWCVLLYILRVCMFLLCDATLHIIYRNIMYKKCISILYMLYIICFYVIYHLLQLLRYILYVAYVMLLYDATTPAPQIPLSAASRCHFIICIITYPK